MNIKLQFTENNFDSQQSDKCDLLIQIRATGISYAIVNKEQNQLKALADVEINDLEKATSQIPLLQKQYRNIKISTTSNKFTFIPAELFSQSSLADYAQFIQPDSVSDLMIDEIRSFKIKNVHAINKHTQNILRSHFPNAAIYNQATPLIEGCLKMAKNDDLNQLFINIGEKSFEAVIIKDKQLRFYNIFDCFNPDEFNYFLLVLIKHFQLDALNTKILLTGFTVENDPFYFRIKKYFNNIEQPVMNELIWFNPPFDQAPLQQYFSLISLNLCE